VEDEHDFAFLSTVTSSQPLLPKARDLAEVIVLYYNVCVSVVQYVLLDQ
jgi:hypothetical protein